MLSAHFRYLLLTKERFVSGLGKVQIVGEGSTDAFGLHYLKARAICEAPAFVLALLITLERPCKLFCSLRKYNY